MSPAAVHQQPVLRVAVIELPCGRPELECSSAEGGTEQTLYGATRV
jgi:hypothetical protein